jgi:hypothetical protein
MCDNYGLVSKPTTTYNPRANGIIEHIHQVLGDSLCTIELENIELPLYDPYGSFLSATAWAICSTYHTTLQATLGQLVFGRDMLLSYLFEQIGLGFKQGNKTSSKEALNVKTVNA